MSDARAMHTLPAITCKYSFAGWLKRGYPDTVKGRGTGICGGRARSEWKGSYSRQSRLRPAKRKKPRRSMLLCLTNVDGRQRPFPLRWDEIETRARNKSETSERAVSREVETLGSRRCSRHFLFLLRQQNCEMQISR